MGRVDVKPSCRFRTRSEAWFLFRVSCRSTARPARQEDCRARPLLLGAQQAHDLGPLVGERVGAFLLAELGADRSGARHRCLLQHRRRIVEGHAARRRGAGIQETPKSLGPRLRGGDIRECVIPAKVMTPEAERSGAGIERLRSLDPRLPSGMPHGGAKTRRSAIRGGDIRECVIPAKVEDTRSGAEWCGNPVWREPLCPPTRARRSPLIVQSSQAPASLFGIESSTMEVGP